MKTITLTEKDYSRDEKGCICEYSDAFEDVLDDMTTELLSSGWYYRPSDYIKLDCGLEIQSLNKSNLEFSLYDVNIEDFMEWYYDSVFMTHLRCNSEKCSQSLDCDIEASFEHDILGEFNDIVHKEYFKITEDLKKYLTDNFNALISEWEYQDVLDSSFYYWIENVLNDYHKTVTGELNEWLEEEHPRIEWDATVTNIDYIIKYIESDGEYEHTIY